MTASEATRCSRDHPHPDIDILGVGMNRGSGQRPASTRVAVFYLRAWIEGQDGRFVARITQTTNLADRRATREVVGSASDVLERVRRWLTEVQAQ
jgi:hypothetical protein